MRPVVAFVSMLLLDASAMARRLRPRLVSDVDPAPLPLPACCCCDISKPAISCNYLTPAEECVCADVVCPDNAPTIYPSGPHPTLTVTLAITRTPTATAAVEDDACCCCDIARGVVSCNPLIPKDRCVCADVVCPANAPTVSVKPAPQPTKKTLKPGPSSPTTAAVTPMPKPKPGQKRCCCCDTTKIVCQNKPVKIGCICMAVVCPPDASTIFIGATATSAASH